MLAPGHGKCHVEHDTLTSVFTALLLLGLIASYLPQHWRIISKKSSEGFSPWFLLLGSTSSASVMLNVVALQWGVIKCCSVVSAGSCVESLGGVAQVALTWFLFTMILVLYMIYFPEHLKYSEVDISTRADAPPMHLQTTVKTDEWRLAITLSWVVAFHIVLIIFVTFLLIGTNASRRTLELWTGFLGMFSACLAVVQYLPQLLYTWNTKLVGALSIPMMCIQTPGAILMVTSIAIRPDTNWTSWAPFAVAGVMQGILLVMCLFWQQRQNKLGLDEFGRPLSADAAGHVPQETSPLLGSSQ
ncbi:hypothetical protein EXIGLDRAFT_738753 [Exidia glandulosa HHB12029]|uniref:PQ loop repeat protein n=1 Tax=Exidia glandulosa HHB12029 TaxID=1314781 RepID=A0A166BEM9_EXIGL|nr:hypothetical protein EXIGLDRAFT_738753 [Exidia glandulosa HHB12029]